MKKLLSLALALVLVLGVTVIPASAGHISGGGYLPDTTSYDINNPDDWAAFSTEIQELEKLNELPGWATTTSWEELFYYECRCNEAHAPHVVQGDYHFSNLGLEVDRVFFDNNIHIVGFNVRDKASGDLIRIDLRHGKGKALYAEYEAKWQAMKGGETTPTPKPSPTANPAPTTPATPATNTAYASTQTVNVDGKAVTFECYALKDANGNATNYIKLRDLAMLLNGSAAQFQVGWDGSVTITTKTAYTPNGSELSTPYSGDRVYQKTTATTKVNGQAADLAAFVLNDDAGGGYTYYQLRDLGKALGFNVGWAADKGIFVETDKPYDTNN